MDPFMQEIVSILSIILGVIVLTAWVMWILLRPSGDNKVQEFASESVKDGITLTMIENNELKNTITRLERELRVLMSAGYGNAGEERITVEERGKTKNEEPKVNEKAGGDAVLVGGASRGDDSVREDEQKGRHEVKPSEELKAKWKSTDEKGTIVDQRLLLRADPKTVEERGKARGEKGKLKVEEQKAKEKSDDSELPVVGATHGEASTEHVTEKKPVEATPKPAEYIQSSGVSPLSEAQRITDEDEKKKIADYLASIVETTERQMKEVEALEDDDELAEGVSPYPVEDLKKIKGIGPHLEGRLKKAGISSYQQIAEFNDEDIQRVAQKIGYFPRRIKRDEWVVQAQGLVS